jgi:hypothetical protein
MLVCKFEINSSTILERLQHISDGRTNGRTPGISISPAPFWGGGGGQKQESS